MFIFKKLMNQYVGRRTYLLTVVTSGVIVVITALLLEYSVGYLMGLQAAQLRCGGPCLPGMSVETELRSNLNLIHVKIGIGFLASVLGLLSRRIFGFFVSLAGLIWVTVTYIAWYISTSRFVAEYATEQTKLTDQYLRNIGFFRDANWVDWVILAVAIMLIIWHILVAVRLIQSKPA